MLSIRKRIVCADGFSLSVQADEYKYCSPRDDAGPWHAMEVGFIQNTDGEQVAPPETWREYADGDFPSDVYGYVPLRLIEIFVGNHGGADCWWLK